MINKFLITLFIITFSYSSLADDHFLKLKPSINLALAKIMADACEE